ncbi:MAG: class I adenylate-forming enzyme family protein [Syntrophales bacterium]|nr:class I adenylate-forming enzyme family protein [Syntrophales bacterium]
MPIPQNLLDRAGKLLSEIVPNCADCVARYAEEKPDAVAFIMYTAGRKITWRQFEAAVNAYASRLLASGLKKGDIVATILTLTEEHIYLIYASFRIGLIVAPLDVRLKGAEIQYSMDRMNPRAVFFLGKTPVADFRPLVAEVMSNTPSAKTWVQIQPDADGILNGAIGIREFTGDAITAVNNEKSAAIRKARKLVEKRDPCLIIFTTGSTGSPKPALLCHENILTQNVTFGVFSMIDAATIFLNNLPPSHIACTTEVLATTIFMGGTMVVMDFDPKRCFEAIQEHRITHILGIPAMFTMLWRFPDYDKYDRSSLRVAVFGGQQVPRSWVEQLQAMVPNLCTGLGITEASGATTSNCIPCTVDDVMDGIGLAMPYFPLTVREPMNPDGTAGAEKPAGEVGEICFQGPQVFLGYLGDPEKTAQTISREGVLYTGDLGSYDAKGLHLAGRRKFVMKPKGYQVFPSDVEGHIAQALKGRIGTAAVVGAEHEIFTEGIMAFVEVPEGSEVTAKDVHEACKEISSYSRPSHVEIIKVGALPLTRSAKTDYMALKERAGDLVRQLRTEGKWDR